MNHFPYFTDIEETFIRCRGKALFLSSKDWALIDDWQKRGIPLHLPIRVIEDGFKGETKPTTLAWFIKPLERAWAEWQAGRAGASNETERLANCEACQDSGEIGIPAANPLFTGQLDYVRCECKN